MPSFFNLLRSDRRQHARQATRGVSTPLGEVVNLSGAGAGVFHKGAPVTSVGQNHQLTLRHEQHAVTIEARVARITPLGFRRQEIGLEFTEPTPEQQSELRTLMALAAAPGLSVGPQAWVAA